VVRRGVVQDNSSKDEDKYLPDICVDKVSEFLLVIRAVYLTRK
jgi:hypothetical protein